MSDHEPPAPPEQEPEPNDLDAATPAPEVEPAPAPEDGDPLAVALRERDEYLDALQRKQAEFENFRKRMVRDSATQRIAGHAEVAERLLDVLDDFDRTLHAAGEAVERRSEPAVERRSEPAVERGSEPAVEPGFLKGVQLVHDKLAGVLADFGLTRIDEVGVAFDPNRHEAVQQVPAEGDATDGPQVAQVLRPGYELGGRVLRAAMVVVTQ